jgi:hypothetical protein
MSGPRPKFEARKAKFENRNSGKARAENRNSKSEFWEPKKRLPLVTTKGNKMEVAAARVAFRFNSQQEKNSPPFLGRKGGAPSVQYPSIK